METKQLIEALTPLANKLGEGASEIYQAYYRQAFINGIQDLLWFLVLGGFVVFCIRKFIPQMYKSFKEDYAEGMALGLSVLGLFVVSFVAILCLMSSVTSFANPQYWAIRNLIAEVKGE